MISIYQDYRNCNNNGNNISVRLASEGTESQSTVEFAVALENYCIFSKIKYSLDICLYTHIYENIKLSKIIKISRKPGIKTRI